jgi:AcrR family transcriptional regulator
VSAVARKKSKATKTKPSRAERNEEVRRRLFFAAAKIVGRYGYSEASVARITAKAGVAQGTFYNHFANRQELLDQLLPTMGRTMLDFIRDRVDRTRSEPEREIERFRAFFDFLREVPEFLRILNEAEFFAPMGHAQHFANIVAGYLSILKRARAENSIHPFSDDELEVLVHILLGARGYLSRQYAYAGSRVHEVPDHVLSAYEKLLTRGLFAPGADRPSRGKRTAAGYEKMTDDS